MPVIIILTPQRKAVMTMDELQPRTNSRLRRPHHDDPAAIEHGQRRDRHAAPERDAQRRVGKRDDAVDGEADHLAQRIFRLARGARRAMELHHRLGKSEPGEHAAHETVAFGHGAKTIEHLAVDEAEIADIARNVDRRELADQPVEQIGRHRLEAAFTLARQPLGIDDVEALFPFGDHIEDDFGRILKVGVHHNDRVAFRPVHAGGDGDLVAEIARQLDVAIALVRARLGFANDGARIARAVVDENRLGGRIELVEQGVEPAQQNRQHRLFVVDGDDERIDRFHEGARLTARRLEFNRQRFKKGVRRRGLWR